MAYFLRYLAAESHSQKIRVIFGGWSWSPNITQFSAAMTWLSKIILFLVVIFTKIAENSLAIEKISGLFSTVSS
jgi:hypothetical protein